MTSSSTRGASNKLKNQGREAQIEAADAQLIRLRTGHGGQTHLTISHTHAEAAWVEATCREIARFFKLLRQTAEQLTTVQRWRCVLARALDRRAAAPVASNGGSDLVADRSSSVPSVVGRSHRTCGGCRRLCCPLRAD